MVMTMMPPRKPTKKRQHAVLARPEQHDAKNGKRDMNPDASDSPEESFDLPNFNPITTLVPMRRCTGQALAQATTPTTAKKRKSSSE